MSENPYSSPRSETESSEAILSSEEAIAVRTPSLTREVIVRTIGVLFFIKAVGLLSQIPFFLNVVDELGHELQIKESTLYFRFGQWVVLAIVCGFTGWGLWKFRRWAWILSLILLIAAVLTSTRNLPLIPPYVAVLLVLLLPKTRTLFSENYRRALSQSPKIKYGAKRVALVIVILLLLMAAFGLMMEFVG